MRRRLPPVALDQPIGRLRRGAADPTHRRTAAGWWRATRTPQGPVLLRLVGEGTHTLVEAWGAGAEWAVETAEELLGLHDDRSGFRPGRGIVGELHRRHPQLRIGRTNAVTEALIPSIIEQKVTGKEAFGAWARLIRRYGEPAPGPAGWAGSPASGMRLQPSPEQWTQIPSWEWRRSMVEDKRSAAVVRVARRAAALERTLDAADPDTALRSLPGVGAWTSAEVRAVAHGDPDAWSVGDYHVPREIVHALTGQVCPREAADARATELLQPWLGHRLRVQLLVMASGLRPERHGPRRSLPTHLPR
ncbi:DNA-3-methyladenine glycosylase family protein [Naumannella halotolerans]|uniref:DNA-3-methyladenine glycosylase family protein n=1 Tax=Naumannella halotolerans TaxID=993414 RepID=UPI00370DD5A9